MEVDNVYNCILYIYLLFFSNNIYGQRQRDMSEV